MNEVLDNIYVIKCKLYILFTVLGIPNPTLRKASSLPGKESSAADKPIITFHSRKATEQLNPWIYAIADQISPKFMDELVTVLDYVNKQRKARNSDPTNNLLSRKARHVAESKDLNTEEEEKAVTAYKSLAHRAKSYFDSFKGYFTGTSLSKMKDEAIDYLGSIMRVDFKKLKGLTWENATYDNIAKSLPLIPTKDEPIIDLTSLHKAFDKLTLGNIKKAKNNFLEKWLHINGTLLHNLTFKNMTYNNVAAALPLVPQIHKPDFSSVKKYMDTLTFENLKKSTDKFVDDWFHIDIPALKSLSWKDLTYHNIANAVGFLPQWKSKKQIEHIESKNKQVNEHGTTFKKYGGNMNMNNNEYKNSHQTKYENEEDSKWGANIFSDKKETLRKYLQGESTTVGYYHKDFDHYENVRKWLGRDPTTEASSIKRHTISDEVDYEEQSDDTIPREFTV